MGRRRNVNILVSQCSRQGILQKPSRDIGWWMCPAGINASGIDALAPTPGEGEKNRRHCQARVLYCFHIVGELFAIRNRYIPPSHETHMPQCSG